MPLLLSNYKQPKKFGIIKHIPLETVQHATILPTSCVQTYTPSVPFFWARLYYFIHI